MQYKQNSIFAAAAEVLSEGTQYFMMRQRKYPQFRVIHYSRDRKDVSEKGEPQKFTAAAAEKAKSKFDVYGDYEIVPWEAKPAKKIKEAKKIVSLNDPVWDASFDGKTIETKLTWDEIATKAKRLKPGSKVVSDNFTVPDLKDGVHKSIIFNAGAKGSLRVRVQLHPMNKKKLSGTPDSFGTVK